MKTQYAERDHEKQGEHYMTHLSAMTGEDLHSKSAIAAELAHRDIEIERLRGALDHVARVALGARDKTKRVVWIAARAKSALSQDTDWTNAEKPHGYSVELDVTPNADSDGAAQP